MESLIGPDHQCTVLNVAQPRLGSELVTFQTAVQCFTLLLCLIETKGLGYFRSGGGGGTSGRAKAFCLGRPVFNPGMDFISSELLSIYPF